MDNIENSKQPTSTISVDAGVERIAITDNLGREIGVFLFNPHDVGILDRFNRMAGDFEKITEPLAGMGSGEDGPAEQTGAGVLDALHKAEQRLYKACDYMFGGNMSEAFFGKVHPFSPVNGKFYCENALEAVGSYLAARLGGEAKQLNARMDTYLHGRNTRTSKHKSGET